MTKINMLFVQVLQKQLNFVLLDFVSFKAGDRRQKHVLFHALLSIDLYFTLLLIKLPKFTFKCFLLHFIYLRL